MAGLLGRARKLIGPNRAERVPLTFRIRCGCGQVTEGARRATCQIFDCPSCGSPLFVLPQSPNPVPEGRHKERPSAPATVDRPAPGSPEPPMPRPARPAKARPVRRPKKRTAPAVVETPARFDWSVLVPKWSWRHNPRIILAGVVVVLLIAGWWQWHQSGLRRLRELLVPEGRRGLQALAAGHWDEAREHLRFTNDALDRLGEPFPDEPRFRQAWAELHVLDDLIDRPLDMLLAGIETDPDRIGGPIEGKSILLDATVEPTSSGWKVDYVVFVDHDFQSSTAPIQISIDPAGIDLFARLGSAEPERWIFGARIDRVARDSKGAWMLTLASDSGVLMSEPQLYVELGLARDPETEPVRRRQSGILEVWFESAGEEP